MNPLVEKMLNTTVSNDVETRFLEDLFKDDCKCEAEHENTQCSIEIIWRAEACYWLGSRNICNNTIGARCKACKNPTSECWTIRPI